jgi:hypothetical protein
VEEVSVGLEGLKVAIPIFLLAFPTVFIGGIFVFLILCSNGYQRLMNEKPYHYGAFLQFAIALIPDCGVVYWWLFPPSAEWIELHDRLHLVLMIAGVIASFLLVVVSLVVATRRRDPLLKTGSWILFVVNLIGISMLVIGSL